MSKNFRDRLDSWARRAHVNYFGEHLSYDERGALDNVDTPLDASNPPVTKDDLATSTVTSFNGRVGAVTPAVADYNASDIDNDSSVAGSKVDDALDELQTEVETNATNIAVINAEQYPDTMTQAIGVEMNHRTRVLDDSGTYYANEGANEISALMTNALYKKVNLLLTPSGTKAGTGAGDGKLYSVKGSDFTAERNSVKSYVDIDGYIRFGAIDEATIDYSSGAAVISSDKQSTNKILYPFSYENSYWSKSGAAIELDQSTAGAELITNGTFTGNASGWTLGSGWSYGTDNVTHDATTGYNEISQSITTVANTSYKVEVEIVSYNSGNGIYFVSIGGSGDSPAYKTVGTHTFYFVANSTTTNIRISTQGSFEGTIDNVSVKEVQGFASPFKDASGNIQLVARKLVEDGSNGQHYMYKSSHAVNTGSSYAYSVIAKAGERDWIAVSLYEQTSAISGTAYFDLKNGTKGGCTSNYSSEIKELADGYYICTVQVTINSATTGLNVYEKTSDADYSPTSPIYQGDGTSGIYIAGSQLEEQPVATSFINDPADLEGSEVTRLEDNIGGAGSVALFNSINESGVLFAEIVANNNPETGIISIAADANNKVQINIPPWPATSITARVRCDGVYVYTETQSGLDLTNITKIAVRWNDDYVSIWINGVEYKKVVPTPALSFSSSLSTLQFTDYGGGYSLAARVSAVGIYNYLSDAEMVKLTTN